MLFDVIDPRGFRVFCTIIRWREHVVEHSIMIGEEASVVKAITDPTYGIYADKDYPERSIYYFRKSSKPLYVKVVVKFSDDGVGEVITAFMTDSLKSGEKMIWPKSSG